MKSGQFRLHVNPIRAGSFTRWRLTGSVVTAIPHHQMRRLIESLSLWSNWPVELVLPVDVATANWFEWWAEVIDVIPEDHLYVRFKLKRRDGNPAGLTP